MGEAALEMNDLQIYQPNKLQNHECSCRVQAVVYLCYDTPGLFLLVKSKIYFYLYDLQLNNLNQLEKLIKSLNRNF